MQRVFDSAVNGGAISRRRFAGVMMVPGLFAFASREPGLLRADEKFAKDANRTLTSLHQQIEIPVAPAKLLDAILNEKQFSSLTGFGATIDATEGGAFTVFDGLVKGRNIEIVPGTRLVQAWRPASWLDGVYSLVRLDLSATESGSIVVLDQTGFPEGNYDQLALGWYLHYWEPLKRYFA